MKKNNILKVMLITIFITVVLTWIVNASYFDGNTNEIVSNGTKLQVGIFNLFNYFMMAATSYFGYIPLYILAIGGFYGILYQTNGYRNLLDKIVSKYEGNEWVFLTLSMIILAVITSVTGISFGLLFIFPFIITVILLMGYNKVTSALVTVGSVCVGLIGTTYSLTDVSTINQVLSLQPDNEIIARLIILVVTLLVLIFNVLLYARKHKIDTPRKGFLYPESGNPKAKTWPITLVFDLVVVIMVLAFLSWTDMFGVQLFDDALESINNFEIGGFPIFAKILGQESLPAFGAWSQSDLFILVIVAGLIIAFLCKVKFDDMIKGFFEGAKRAVLPACVAVLAYTIFFVCSSISFPIIKPVLQATDSFNIVIMTISGLLANFFSIEMYYSAVDFLPFIKTLFLDNYPLIAVIWQATNGLVKLFVPTSAILVVTLSYLNVSYWKWLKSIWKLLLELLVVLLTIFLIMFMI